MARDYYKILGISRGASAEEVKKAYRHLAHQHHPDKAGGNDAKFKEINEAYQVLSNSEKRAQYDRFGQVFDGSSPSWGNTGFGDGFRWNVNLGEDMGDFGDIFESMFEQFGGKRRQTYTQGSDIEVAQEITLEEAFAGVVRTLHLRTQVPCATCHALGYDKAKGMKACATCNGRGEVRIERKTFFGNFSQVQACGACQGRGEVPQKPCGTCHGSGRVAGVREVPVAFAPGIEDGQVIKVTGAGEAGERGGQGGDLYVIVKVRPHQAFERKKDDLYTVQDLRLTDALLGKQVNVKGIDGEQIEVVIPSGYNLREPLRIPRHGMPKFGGMAGAFSRGDLIIAFNVKLPGKLSSRAKKLLEELGGEL